MIRRGRNMIRLHHILLLLRLGSHGQIRTQLIHIQLLNLTTFSGQEIPAAKLSSTARISDFVPFGVFNFSLQRTIFIWIMKVKLLLMISYQW